MRKFFLLFFLGAISIYSQTINITNRTIGSSNYGETTTLEVQESTSRRNIISNYEDYEILGKVKTVDDSFYTSGVEAFYESLEKGIKANKEYEDKMRRKEIEINNAVKSDIMNAFQYSNKIPFTYKNQGGIKSGEGYALIPTMVFKPEGLGKFIKYDGLVKITYNLFLPSEKNIDVIGTIKNYENLSYNKFNTNENWEQTIITPKIVYGVRGVSATVYWEDQYDRGIRIYYGAEDSNGIDYWVEVEGRADKNDVERNEMKKVFNFYKPLLERCIANSNVNVKKLISEKEKIKIEESKRALYEANKNLKTTRELFNFTEIKNKLPELRKKYSKKNPLQSLGNINKFKYAVLLKANSNYSYIKKSLSKYWNSKLPELVIIENLNDIPEDLKLNPNLGVYLDVSIESFNEVFTKSSYFLYENNSNLFYSTKNKMMSANKSIKSLVDKLEKKGYLFDSNLVEPYTVKSSKKIETKSNSDSKEKLIVKPNPNINKIQTDDDIPNISKEEAIKEIKSLKELYDIEILSKEEYEKRARILKKIILEKK